MTAATLQRLALVALAGAVGTLCRYGVGQLCAGRQWNLVWGTFFVNMLGAFLFGLIVGLWDTRHGLSPEVKIILLGGFMGAFTTFSTLANETSTYLGNGRWAAAVFYMTLTAAVGTSLALGGEWLGRNV